MSSCRSVARVLASLASLALLPACTTPPSVETTQAPLVEVARPEPGAIAAPKPPPCAALPALAGATAPMRRESSTVALRRAGAGLYAYAADPDALTIDVVDVHGRKVVGAVATSGPVEQVLVLPSGHVVATLQTKDYLEILAPSDDGALTPVCSSPVPVGGFAMALSEDGELAVTSRTAATVTLLDARTLEVRRVVGLPRAPAGVLYEGGALYVSHLVGAHVSVVDRATNALSLVPTALEVAFDERALNAAPIPFTISSRGVARPSGPRSASQAFTLVSVEAGAAPSAVEGVAPVRGTAPPSDEPPRALVAEAPKGRIVVPMISVDPGAPTRPTSHYYGPPEELGVPKQAHVGFLIDPATRSALSRKIVADRPELARDPCYAPRGAAYDRSTQSLFVTCVGTDTLLELDARSADPLRAVKDAVRTPRGPTGVAVAAEEGLVVVMGTLEGRVAIIDRKARTSTLIDLDLPLTKEAAQSLVGRQLFQRANDRALSFDGLACASCHIEGGEDGLSWMTPSGPRQTLMLAGRLQHSAPFGWDRGAETLDEYVRGTVDRLGGEGLGTAEVSALIDYVASIPSPPAEVLDAARVVEGEALFRANGCGECHAGGGSNHTAYDLGGAMRVDTPSLSRVGLSAPYYHDGRYATLDDLLRDKGSKMGRVSELDETSIRAIETYLRSL